MWIYLASFDYCREKKTWSLKQISCLALEKAAWYSWGGLLHHVSNLNHMLGHFIFTYSNLSSDLSHLQGEELLCFLPVIKGWMSFNCLKLAWISHVSIKTLNFWHTCHNLDKASTYFHKFSFIWPQHTAKICFVQSIELSLWEPKNFKGISLRKQHIV